MTSTWKWCKLTSKQQTSFHSVFRCSVTAQNVKTFFSFFVDIRPPVVSPSSIDSLPALTPSLLASLPALDSFLYPSPPLPSVTRSDLATLTTPTSWLNADIMDACSGIICAGQDRVLLLGSFYSYADMLENNRAAVLRELLKRVTASTSSLVAVMNDDQSHWYCLHIERTESTLYDSMQSVSAHSDHIDGVIELLNWVKTLLRSWSASHDSSTLSLTDSQSRSIRTQLESNKQAVAHLGAFLDRCILLPADFVSKADTKQQSDSFSCGPRTLLNVLHLVRGDETDSVTNDEARRYFAAMLTGTLPSANHADKLKAMKRTQQDIIQEFARRQELFRRANGMAEPETANESDVTCLTCGLPISSSESVAVMCDKRNDVMHKECWTRFKLTRPKRCPRCRYQTSTARIFANLKELATAPGYK